MKIATMTRLHCSVGIINCLMWHEIESTLSEWQSFPEVARIPTFWLLLLKKISSSVLAIQCDTNFGILI